jgi:hypothetical protein
MTLFLVGHNISTALLPYLAILNSSVIKECGDQKAEVSNPNNTRIHKHRMSAAPHAFQHHVLVHILDAPVHDGLAVILAPLQHTAFYVTFIVTIWFEGSLYATSWIPLYPNSSHCLTMVSPTPRAASSSNAA